MLFDFAKMQKIVERVKKIQPPQPPPDRRFEEVNETLGKVVQEEPTRLVKENGKR